MAFVWVFETRNSIHKGKQGYFCMKKKRKELSVTVNCQQPVGK